MEQDSHFKTIFGEEVYSFPVPVTVVIDVPWSDVKEDQRVLLSKILHAVKLSTEGVRMLHLAQFDLSSFEEKHSRVLAFITPPKGLASYEVIQTGSTSVIFSDPLEKLIADDAGKRKLWAALKGLFEA